MRNRILGCLSLMVVASALALGLAACATSSAPQTQAERGDALGTRVAVTVNAFNVTPATTQPSAPGDYHVERATLITLTSTTVTAAGTSTSGTTATAGNPQNNNTPKVDANVPINVTPGSGTVLGR